MNTYNVTVNGALDSESTARQIVNIINDSQARGTLGAGAFGAVGFLMSSFSPVWRVKIDSVEYTN
jgi:hypothetical protein